MFRVCSWASCRRPPSTESKEESFYSSSKEGITLSEATYTNKLSARHVLVALTGIMIRLAALLWIFAAWSAFQLMACRILGVERTTGRFM